MYRTAFAVMVLNAGAVASCAKERERMGGRARGGKQSVFNHRARFWPIYIVAENNGKAVSIASCIAVPGTPLLWMFHSVHLYCLTSITASICDECFRDWKNSLGNTRSAFARSALAAGISISREEQRDWRHRWTEWYRELITKSHSSAYFRTPTNSHAHCLNLCERTAGIVNLQIICYTGGIFMNEI